MRTRYAVAVAACVATACTANPPAPEARRGTDPDRPSTSATTAVPSSPSATASSAAGSPVGPAAPPDSGNGATARATARAAAPSGDRPRRGPARQVDLFGPDVERRGFTDREITLCSHGAIHLTRLYGMEPEDLDVSWQAVNDAGGIHGRRVREHWANDHAKGEFAAQAMEECRSTAPAFIRSAPSVGTIVPAREWAEENNELYLYYNAPERRSTYSFTYMPSLERYGELSGQYVARTHRGRRLGVIWRDDQNAALERRAFLRAAADRGMRPVVDRSVRAEQGQYYTEIDDLKRNRVEVVWLLDNGLSNRQFVQQAHDQQYRPYFVLHFPSNNFFDMVSDALNPPIEGISTWPAYYPGARGGRFAAYEHEIRAYEAAMLKYRDKVPDPDADLGFAKWVEDWQYIELLRRCGRDCTRDRLAALMVFNQAPSRFPQCPVDFGRDGRLGGTSVNVWRATPYGGAARWEQTVTCADGF